MSMFSLVLGSPELDTVLQKLSHKCQPEGKNHFCSLPLTFLLTTQRAAGHHCWLLVNSFCPPGPPCLPLQRFSPGSWSQPVLLPGVILAQTQDLVLLPLLDFTNFLSDHLSGLSLCLAALSSSVSNTPPVWYCSHTCWTCWLIIQGSFDALYQSLKDTTGNWLPVGLCTTYHHPQAQQSGLFSTHLIVYLSSPYLMI